MATSAVPFFKLESSRALLLKLNGDDGLTFDVVPENGSVVVLSGIDGKGGGCVGFTARVSGDDFDFATVNVATLGDVEMPHAVVNQLVFASLLKTTKKRHYITCYYIKMRRVF